MRRSDAINSVANLSKILLIPFSFLEIFSPSDNNLFALKQKINENFPVLIVKIIDYDEIIKYLTQSQSSFSISILIYDVFVGDEAASNLAWKLDKQGLSNRAMVINSINGEGMVMEKFKLFLRNYQMVLTLGISTKKNQ